jgi:hypothetical protein
MLTEQVDAANELYLTDIDRSQPFYLEGFPHALCPWNAFADQAADEATRISIIAVIDWEPTVSVTEGVSELDLRTDPFPCPASHFDFVQRFDACNLLYGSPWETGNPPFVYNPAKGWFEAKFVGTPSFAPPTSVELLIIDDGRPEWFRLEKEEGNTNTPSQRLVVVGGGFYKPRLERFASTSPSRIKLFLPRDFFARIETCSGPPPASALSFEIEELLLSSDPSVPETARMGSQTFYPSFRLRFLPLEKGCPSFRVRSFDRFAVSAFWRVAMYVEAGSVSLYGVEVDSAQAELTPTAVRHQSLEVTLLRRQVAHGFDCSQFKETWHASIESDGPKLKERIVAAIGEVCNRYLNSWPRLIRPALENLTLTVVLSYKADLAVGGNRGLWEAFSGAGPRIETVLRVPHAVTDICQSKRREAVLRFLLVNFNENVIESSSCELDDVLNPRARVISEVACEIGVEARLAKWLRLIQLQGTEPLPQDEPTLEAVLPQHYPETDDCRLQVFSEAFEEELLPQLQRIVSGWNAAEPSADPLSVEYTLFLVGRVNKWLPFVSHILGFSLHNKPTSKNSTVMLP